MREDEGDDEEEMPLQPAPVPLTLQQAAEHIRAVGDFGLFTYQSRFTVSICQAEDYFLKLNNSVKQIALSRQL